MGIDEVPEQNSRILFGNVVESGRPSYTNSYQPSYTGYGVPQSPVLPDGELFSSSLYVGRYF